MFVLCGATTAVAVKLPTFYARQDYPGNGQVAVGDNQHHEVSAAGSQPARRVSALHTPLWPQTMSHTPSPHPIP
jgi:hypothetical protein